MPARVALLVVAVLLAPAGALAIEAVTRAPRVLDLTSHPVGIAAAVIFALAYLFVMLEELLHLRKSKPVLVAAGLIWVLVAFVYARHGDDATASAAVRANLLEFAELFLFLLVAMTYINTLDERGAFDTLRAKIISRGLSFRAVFWLTGALAFCLSPVADNLTTALIMGAVVVAIGAGRARYVSMCCVNIVVAANAGGAFSPFGDITTLMVWQRGVVEFAEFFKLFLPSLANWIVPALLMTPFLDKGRPEPLAQRTALREGAVVVALLFLATIATAVLLHSVLHLPPVIGMMAGLGALQIFGYFLKRRSHYRGDLTSTGSNDVFTELGHGQTFDIFKRLEKAEWDTLLFFYGVILCVGGLGLIGYLSKAAALLYGAALGPTAANVAVGLLSALVDNIPVMYAVLAMEPDMALGQWLLVTLTAGVGGSLLAIGSAAGVGLMGSSRGSYTFLGHLRWTWAVALGYVASIAVHLVVNRATF